MSGSGKEIEIFSKKETANFKKDVENLRISKCILRHFTVRIKDMSTFDLTLTWLILHCQSDLFSLAIQQHSTNNSCVHAFSLCKCTYFKPYSVSLRINKSSHDHNILGMNI